MIKVMMLNATFNISVIWGVVYVLLVKTYWRKLEKTTNLPQVTDRLYPNMLGLRYSNDTYIYICICSVAIHFHVCLVCSWSRSNIWFSPEFQLHQIVNVVGKVQLQNYCKWCNSIFPSNHTLNVQYIYMRKSNKA